MIPKNLKPTESELEILSILWREKNTTVRMVHEELLKTKEAGYTTTLKLMQIMHEKGLLTRNTDSKIHLYQAAIDKAETQSQIVNKMVSKLFSGSPTEMVMQALGSNKTTNEELQKIEKLITELKKQNSK
jgi:BlaI family transcriptional regulator, penicillinase repressor